MKGKMSKVSPAVFPDNVSLQYSSNKACVVTGLSSNKLRILVNTNVLLEEPGNESCKMCTF